MNSNTTKDEIRKFSEIAIARSGKQYLKISLHAIKNFAVNHNLKIGDVEILALENGIVPERYQRNVGTIGINGQARLLRSKIAILGLGGLGGTVVELLARMGVGHIVAVDGDVFEESNLNRQILCRENNLGLSKAEAAVERVKNINQGIRVTAHFTLIKEENIGEIIDGADVVVDALDNIPTRFLVEKTAKKKGIPLIHGAIAGFTGQVLTIFPEDKGLKGIYGHKDRLPDSGIETELGTPGITPAMVASWQAQEAVKIILKKGGLLRNKLLYIDGENGTVEIINVG
jgi:molybdopterin/thiamine biosynthesis adenylyltransferase